MSDSHASGSRSTTVTGATVVAGQGEGQSESLTSSPAAQTSASDLPATPSKPPAPQEPQAKELLCTICNLRACWT